MSRYAGLLRGVNVGSTNRITMADLRRLVADLGHTDVKTYLQSGNVVFDSTLADTGKLAKGIERAIADELGLSVAVLVRSEAELAAVVDNNPYPEGAKDQKKLLVALLAAAPDPDQVAQLAVPAGENVRFTVAGREIYLYYPDGGYGRTKVNNAYLEKKLGMAATTRNWKTICVLRDMTAG